MHQDKLLRALAEQGLTVFSIDDVRTMAHDEGIPAASLPSLMTRMTRSGRISRLRRGLYAVSSVLPGGSPAHPFAIAVRIVTPSAISHWSALHYHGLTEQVPRIVTAFTPRKVVTPGMRNLHKGTMRRKHAWIAGGITYEFTTVKPQHFFGIERVWVNEYTRVPITDRERTMLELFISPRTFGGIGEGIGILREHLDTLSVQKLAEYALEYGAVSVAKRLGWALDSAGVSPSALSQLRALPSSGYHLADPSGPRDGVRDRTWMIQNNVGITRPT